MPVTHEKLRKLAINRNISHWPISAGVYLHLAKATLIMKKIKNFSNWNDCNPEILSITLIFFNLH